VLNNNSANVSILPGNGDGTFQAAVNYSVGGNPTSMAATNFNADIRLDLAVTRDGGTVALLNIPSDVNPPQVNCPANSTTNAPQASCASNVTFSVSATDNCVVTNVTAVPASGSSFPVGTTTVTVTAADASGNTNFCTFTVTVNDTQPPVITCPGNITV